MNRYVRDSVEKGFAMKKRSLRNLSKLIITAATVLALSPFAALTRAAANEHDRDREDDHGHGRMAFRLPTGQFVTPTALDDAVQQYLNPNLPAYPDFVAGEAVRSQLSPDGSTLAV